MLRFLETKVAKEDFNGAKKQQQKIGILMLLI